MIKSKKVFIAIRKNGTIMQNRLGFPAVFLDKVQPGFAQFDPKIFKGIVKATITYEA